MGTLFPVLLSLRLLTFSYTFVVPTCSLTLPSLRVVLCSVVSRFILPELSSHFVLHDLLRSFRLECLLPSSCVPPWNLLLVLCFLRGPPFEPLSSCSLRDLTQGFVSGFLGYGSPCWGAPGCL